MEQRQVSDQWKVLLGSSTGLAPTPYYESLVCPSDVSAQSLAAPLSYVVNAGEADVATTVTTMPPDWPANGIFLSRWEYYYSPAGNGGQNALTKLPRNSDDTIRDGKSNTFLLSENLDAKDWYDELSYGDPTIAPGSGKTDLKAGTIAGYSIGGATTNYGYLTAPFPSTATQSTTLGAVSGVTPPSIPSTNTPEIYTAFVWWPSLVAPTFAANINGPNSELNYATDMFFVRPSSNHPGVVNMTFADGRTQTMSENINYTVYCLLMTSDGQKCTPPGIVFQPLANLTGALAPYATFRTQIVSGTDMQ
jgi:prepilin-type processing-associated H-X9-DG protein